MPRSGKGCTGYHAEKTRYTELTAKRQLPADRYLPMDESLAAFTEILRFAQNDLLGGKARNAGFIFIAEGDTTPL